MISHQQYQSLILSKLFWFRKDTGDGTARMAAPSPVLEREIKYETKSFVKTLIFIARYKNLNFQKAGLESLYL